MPGKKQKAKERLDKFYDLAKMVGYRSRASFKLVQLNKKYDFLSKAKTLVDLCAAPGSWSQVAAKEMPAGSTIIAVDLVKIAPLKGVKCLQGDITTEKTRNEIKALLEKKKCEVVVHDGAPNVGGTWAKDAYNQNLLTLKACKLACELLQPDGWFITKIFRSTDSARLIWVMKQLFEKVEQFKPAASRAQSAEVFVVCAGFRAPKKLDANLFSAKTVFEMIDDKQNMDKSDPTLQLQRSKKGVIEYEEGKMLLHRKATVAQFLETEDPKQFLEVHNEIVWDGDEDLLEHKTTNNDIKECFKDLQVISKWDQNKLVKWAKGINKEREEAVKDTREAERQAARLDAEFDNDASDDDEDKIRREIDDMHKRQDKAKKRAEKKIIDRKLLQAERLGYNPADHADAKQTDFFEFSKTDVDELAEVGAAEYDEHAEIGQHTSIPGLDIHKKDEETGMDMVMNDSDDDADDESALEEEAEIGFRDDSGSEEDQDMEGQEITPRMAKQARRDTPAARSTIDYYRSIEQMLDNAYRNREDYESDEVHSGSESEDQPMEEKYINSSEDEDSSTEDDGDDSDSVVQERSNKVRRTNDATDAATAARQQKKGTEEDPQTLQHAVRTERIQEMKKHKKNKKKAPGGFEEIPAALRDPETRARTLAIAQQMLDLGKKRKREILEDGIHRYCYGDEDLPRWFLDDEKRHNVRPLPITKAEVEDQKARFKEINARPAKKVAEAVGRRRRRAADKLKKILAKEKADPRLKGTSEGLTVRKMMRSKELRFKKKGVKLDNKQKGELRLEKKRSKLAKKSRANYKGKKAGKGNAMGNKGKKG